LRQIFLKLSNFYRSSSLQIKQFFFSFFMMPIFFLNFDRYLFQILVFFNPDMKANRDFTVMIWNHTIGPKNSFVDVYAGSGIRFIRILKEGKPEPERVYANDANPNAFKAIKKNILLNKIRKKSVYLYNEDSLAFLGKLKPQDFIDIDPFGFPGKVWNVAIQKIRKNGILAITATDTAALKGSAVRAGIIKYGSLSIKNEFMEELGIRILIAAAQRQGAPYEKALVPIFSYNEKYYMRVFFLCKRGRSPTEDILQNQGYVLYCPSCLYRATTTNIFNERKCPICQESLLASGPLWLGNLWDPKIVMKMLSHASDLDMPQKKMLETIARECEIETIGFYDMHKIAQRFKINTTPSIDKTVVGLQQRGFPSARTHFSAIGIRSSANIRIIKTVMKSI